MMKKSEEEKNIFLSICCPHDRDMLTGKTEMKKEDFERITSILDVISKDFCLDV